MSDNTRTNSKPQYAAHSSNKTGNFDLLLRFVVFMAWVIGIGFLLSLIGCKQNEPKIFVIEELVECKNTYQNNITGIPILISTLKSISLYVSRTSCDERSNR